jgi:hypothetical protein
VTVIDARILALASLSLVLVLVSAPAARAEEELSPATKEALEDWKKGDAGVESALTAAPEHVALRRALVWELDYGPHELHGRVLDLLERVPGARPQRLLALFRIAGREDEHRTFAELAVKLTAEEKKTYERPLLAVLTAYVALDREPATAVLALEAVTGEKLGADRANWAAFAERKLGDGVDPETGLRRAALLADHIAIDGVCAVATGSPDAPLQGHGERARALLSAMESAAGAESLEKEMGEALDLSKELRERPEPGAGALADAVYNAARFLRLAREDALLCARYEKEIVVTAIVLDPRPDCKNRAIIHYSGQAAIYEEGDTMRDGNGRSLGGLCVAKIASGTVRFSFAGRTFTIPLKAPR